MAVEQASLILFLGWCFFLHFLADFPFQSRWMATNKSSSIKALGAHIGIVFVVFLVGTLSPLLAGANALVHMVIDATVWNLYKSEIRRKFWYDQKGFEEFRFWEHHWFWVTLGIDQFLHAATIFWVVRFFYV